MAYDLPMAARGLSTSKVCKPPVCPFPGYTNAGANVPIFSGDTSRATMDTHSGACAVPADCHWVGGYSPEEPACETNRDARSRVVGQAGSRIN
mmetsp:Transcript_276/g.549  ORF Transcript_276/g.549 Transcript_276/m.549 type:complete len:93 (-) Transcript_276:27-305(-)